MSFPEKHSRCVPWLIAIPAYLAISLLGLKYAYYRIFTWFAPHDDEGSFMQYLQAYAQDTSYYDSIQSWYGPFFYLHKYLIYSVLNSDISHDITRLITIAMWGAIALLGGLFVHRVTRSVVLGIASQILLLLHLKALETSPGHPQEIALFLVTGSLLFAGFLGSPRFQRTSMIGLGTLLGALILVKVNVGAFVAFPLALATLLSMPRRPLDNALLVTISLAAIALPTMLMWRHSFSPSPEQSYSIIVTLTITSILITTWRMNEDAKLNWIDIIRMATATVLTMAVISGLVIAWGGSIGGIIDATFLRAMRVPGAFRTQLILNTALVYTSVLSVFLAISYRVFAHRIGTSPLFDMGIALLKLFYGCFTLYCLYKDPGGIFIFAIPLPFIWLVLIGINIGTRNTVNAKFPRTFLCFLAAFQSLQAYPSPGAQVYWSGILLVPLAAICIGDSIRTLWPKLASHGAGDEIYHSGQWIRNTVAIVSICLAGSWFHGVSRVEELQRFYWNRTALELPGAARIRLTSEEAGNLQNLVRELKIHCDGFLGMPGSPSLYFWTGMKPPATISADWQNTLQDDQQYSVINIMESYNRSCAVYNPETFHFWNRDRAAVHKKPLVNYIHTQFTEIGKHGNYHLLIRNAE